MKKTVSEAASVLTPAEVLKELMKNTKEDGALTIPAENYCDRFDAVVPEDAPAVTVKMAWQDPAELAARAEKLIDAFRQLATLPEDAPISDELSAIGETYLADFEIGMISEGENYPLNEAEEAKILAAHRASHAADAARRVGESPYAYAVVMRAGRLYRLFRFHAPRIVLDREVMLFTQTLALHAFAVK